MAWDIWVIALDDGLLSDQTIFWTNVDSTMVFCGTCFRKKSQEVFNKWTCKMSLKQSLIKLLPHLLGPTNQLTLMLLIVASGVWYILIPIHFDSSMPVTKLINRVSDQHQPVTSCWALWRGMIWYHVMAILGLVRTQYWCSINTWPRKNGRQFANDYSILFSSIKIGTSCLKFHRDLLPSAQLTLSVLIQIMACCRAGDKPLSKPLLTL